MQQHERGFYVLRVAALSVRIIFIMQPALIYEYADDCMLGGFTPLTKTFKIDITHIYDDLAHIVSRDLIKYDDNFF